MKLPLDKVALLLIPYLLILSICYDNGYWSLFSISIFNYYEVQDIVKDISGPIFKFGGLVVAPMVVSLAIIITWINKKEFVDENKIAPSDKPVLVQEDVNITVEERIKRIGIKLFKKLKRASIIVLAGIAVATIVIFVTSMFFPFEEEGKFALKYLKSTGSEAKLRFAYITFFSAMAVSSIVENTLRLSKKESAKAAIVFFSFVLTMFVAYHYGRIEAYKVISGAEFRYWIDKEGDAHKYLAKINKHYIFLEDNSFVPKEGNEDFSLDTLKYNPEMKIITDDSLKSVNLDYYGPMTKKTSDAFNKIFKSRITGK
jgi:hypothetical protein